MKRRLGNGETDGRVADGDDETHGRSRALAPPAWTRRDGRSACRSSSTRAGSPVALEAPPALEPELEGEHMLINIGPQHPATHGVLRLVLELDGETVVRCIPHIGYLHCGFEKIGEYRQYNQIIPWTDREDYLNSPGNNVAFALGAERLFGIEITERCKVLRVIACELSRIISHLVWLGTTCIDIGAFTPFLWAFQQRENVYKLLESWIGARLTTTLTRVGGMGADIPGRRGSSSCTHFVKHVPEDARRNRPRRHAQRHLGRPHGRTRRDVAGGSGELRAVGPDAARVRRRVRRAQGLPVPRLRDVRLRRPGRHERRRVRPLPRAHGRAAPVDRASSSRRSKRLPDGPVNVDDHRVILPPKSKATSDMESMIHHFKQVMEGPRPPIGEAYVAVESPKGEKGYYMVSDGTSKPVRWRIRPPSFVNLSAIPQMVEGHLLVRRHRDQRVHRHRDGRDRPMSRRPANGERRCGDSTPSTSRAGDGGRRRQGLRDRSGHGHHEHKPYVPVFTRASARRKELDELLTRYPTKMAALLPALWMVQHERGWVSDEGMAEVAQVLDLTPAYVKGVVTFYTMYHQHPVGKYFIQVCTTSPCNVCGAEEVVDALLKHTGCQELGADVARRQVHA